jgi:serine protease inhibitor
MQFVCQADRPGGQIKVKKINHIFAMLSAVLLFGTFSAHLADTAEASSSKALLRENVVKGNTAFAVQLYRELDAEKGNLFFSPYSISSALGMTYAGASGNTAKEMKDVLHFYPVQSELPVAFRSLNRELAAAVGRTGQKLNIANALVLTGGDVSGEYKKILKNYYDTEVFRGGLDKINGWVKKKTEGKIGKILDQLDTNSVCVILNAIYFKGNWENRFDKSSTHDAPFTVSAGKRVTIPLMQQKGEYRLLPDQDFQAVSIPYKGNSLSMAILLPNTADGLAALEKRVTAQNLEGWLSKLDGQAV